MNLKAAGLEELELEELDLEKLEVDLEKLEVEGNLEELH